MHEKLTPLLLLALLLFSISTTGQPRKIGSPVVHNFPREEYKAGPQNWAIDQDIEDKVVFIGNNDGLMVYANGTFTLTPLPNKTIVRSLAYHKDSKRLYAGGQGTFGYFERKPGGTYHYTCLSDSIRDENFRNFDDVWRIYITTDGSILFNTYKMVAKYREDKGFQILPPDEGLLEFAFAIGNELYAFRLGGGLLKLEGDMFRLSEHGAIFKEDKMAVKAVLPFKGDTHLIATEQNGLFTFDGNSDPQPWLANESAFFKKSFINTGAQLNDGNYAFATKYNGVVIVERLTCKLIAQIDKQHGLPNDNVVFIHQGKDDAVWMGLHNGLAKVELKSKWNFVFIPDNALLGAHDALFRNNKLYLTTPNGLFLKEFKENEVLGKEFSVVPDSEGEAWYLSEVQGDLLMGHNGGAFCIKEDGSLEQMDKSIGYWKFLKVPNRSDLMVAGTYTGIVLFERIGNSPCSWRVAQRFDIESSRIMEFDPDGRSLWMTHVYKGIWRFTFSPDFKKINDTLHVGRENYKQLGLSSFDKINVFRIGNELVFGTEKGVYEFNDNRFLPSSAFKDVFGDTTFVAFMVQDNQHNVWCWANGEPVKLVKSANSAGYEKDKLDFGFLKDNFKSDFECIIPLGGDDAIFCTADGFFKYGANPSVPVVPPPDEQTSPRSNPLIWVLVAGLAILCAVLSWLLIKQKPIVLTPEIITVDEPEPMSGLALLIEYGFEVQLRRTCEELEGSSPDPNQIKTNMSEYEKQIAPYFLQKELYASNRAWIKEFRKQLKDRFHILWKVAVCFKNGMNAKSISDFLSPTPSSSLATVNRHIEELKEKYDVKDEIKLREKLRKLHETTFEDIRHLSIDQYFSQIKSNLHTPPEQLIELMKNYLKEKPSFENRLMEYTMKKPWVRNLKKNYPVLTPTELSVCIGMKNDLVAPDIGVLLLGRDRALDAKKIETILTRLRSTFKINTNDELKDFIMNYPDELLTDE